MHTLFKILHLQLEDSKIGYARCKIGFKSHADDEIHGEDKY